MEFIPRNQKILFAVLLVCNNLMYACMAIIIIVHGIGILQCLDTYFNYAGCDQQGLIARLPEQRPLPQAGIASLY